MVKYMINNSLKIITILLIIILLFFVHCAVRGGKLRNESRTIKLGEAESVARISKINLKVNKEK